ncbi:acetoin dehydrogenase E2 subunit dihydrolipoyllysine-residue acetyltransferase [Legionella massiliensis]|uniref:Acetoin dehydrogenase E2 subunit dihydrolipoyllysine-residue acetyltransferase n=1 Tax=Legionella massiliensis TaxID=1034943 RepID=A0A078KXT2_9GAMM|nr:alpha/beta fold hydrolase [Legionella massiliensis]CDZ76538.1 acetoin dehydrogenase E2 subunit dihydrolipoyllysine-residue acetyltransferase [Legionella massiliensis]CEE12276.1 Alpha/beta hydrolase family protein [Legionella massiliensis]
MIANTIAELFDSIHANLCYQVFITPLYLPIEKEYRDFARKAIEYFATNRSHSYKLDIPRHHVIHHFDHPKNPLAPKILIAHGWMSRAAYMTRLIRALHKQGYQVYAIDFPAHGESKGIQLPWTDAVMILRQTINNFGPFYGVVGHSFGGSMLLNTLNLASKFPEWRLKKAPEKAILIASPTRMRVPVSKLARRLRLSGKGFILLREIFRDSATTDLKHLDLHHFISHSTTPFLCIHGEEDHSIKPYESTIFCEHYPYASLELLPGVNHVSVLIDERVESKVCQFLAS